MEKVLACAGFKLKAFGKVAPFVAHSTVPTEPSNVEKTLESDRLQPFYAPVDLLLKILDLFHTISLLLLTFFSVHFRLVHTFSFYCCSA